MQLLGRRAKKPLTALRDALMAAYAIGVGCRPGELSAVRIKDVHRVATEPFARVWDGKTHGSRRRAPVPAWLVQDIRDYLDVRHALGLPTRPSDYLFLQASGKPFHNDAIQNWTSRVLRPACKRAADADSSGALMYLNGKVTYYSFRRGHISTRVAAGDDKARIARECGTSIQMLDRHYTREQDRRTSVLTDPLDDQVRHARSARASGQAWQEAIDSVGDAPSPAAAPNPPQRRDR